MITLFNQRRTGRSFCRGGKSTKATGMAGNFLLFSVLTGFSACTVGPDYKKPEVETGTTYSNSKLPEYRSLEIDQQWWKQFKEPQLDRLIADAIRNNHNLQAAEANLRYARALFLDAGLDLLPHINTHANYTVLKRSLDSLNRRNFVPRELNLYNVGFDAFWEVDIYGRIRRGIESREAQIEVSQAEIRDLKISLISEVARNYLELRGHQNQLRVAKQNADSQAATLKLTEVRLDAGVGTRLDTSRAIAQLDTTLATIPPLEAMIKDDIYRISILTGQLPATLEPELLPPAPLPKLPELIPIGKPGDLLRRRPDIRAAERDLAGATAAIGVATAELFPKVTFVGTFALESNSFTGLGAAGSGAYNFGPRIYWPAFDLGHVYARIKAADANAEYNLAQYQQTVLNALEETESALVNYTKILARRALLEQSANASLEAYNLVNMRYTEGVEGFLNVLDTERRLLEDQRQHALSETSAAVALVTVYKALGGGWESFASSNEQQRPIEKAFSP